MAEGERTLTIRIKADGSGFVGEARNVAGETDKLGQALGGLKGIIGGTVTLVAAYGAALAYGTKRVIEEQDAVGKLSQIYGIQVEQLSAYAHMAKLANVSDEELALGLRGLIKNMDEATANRGDGGRIFRALGLSTDGKGLDQMLGEIADKFASFKDGPEKAALALQLFGRSGERLIPFLNQGSAGLARLREEAERLGITFGAAAARQAEEFNDNLIRLNATFTATQMAIARDALPALNDYLEQLLKGKAIAGGFWEAIKLFGTMNPFRTAAESVAAYRSEIEILQRRRAGGLSGEFPGADVRAIDAEIDTLKKRFEFAKFLQQQEALKATGPEYLDARDLMARAGGTGTAPRLPDLTREKQLLNQLQDSYSQLTGQVSVYDSVERKMLATEQPFEPLWKKQIEALALKIDATRKASVLAQAAAAQEEDRQRVEREYYEWRGRMDQLYLGTRADAVRATEQARIDSITDPVARARQQLEAEKGYRDEAIKAASFTEEQKRDLYERSAEWYVARQAQLDEQLKPQYQKNLDAWSDTNRLMRENWEREMLAFQQAGEDAFVQFATTGKVQIADLTRTIEQELARSLYRSFIGQAASGGGGLLGFLGMGGGGGPELLAGPGEAHAGGVIGRDSFPMRAVPAAAFAGARRYHMGGLAGDEVPAILQTGETVLPRGVSGGAIHAPLTVAIDARGADAGTEARLREMLRQEIGPALFQQRRTIAGIVENQRRESGRRAV